MTAISLVIHLRHSHEYDSNNYQILCLWVFTNQYIIYMYLLTMIEHKICFHVFGVIDRSESYVYGQNLYSMSNHSFE